MEITQICILLVSIIHQLNDPRQVTIILSHPESRHGKLYVPEQFVISRTKRENIIRSIESGVLIHQGPFLLSWLLGWSK